MNIFEKLNLCKNFMSKQRIPFLNNLPFNPTPPILEKIFHPHPYCQIRGSQSSLYNKGSSNYVRWHSKRKDNIMYDGKRLQKKTEDG